MVSEHSLYKQIASLQQEVQRLKQNDEASKSAACDAMEAQRRIEELQAGNADLREKLAASQQAGGGLPPFMREIRFFPVLIA